MYEEFLGVICHSLLLFCPPHLHKLTKVSVLYPLVKTYLIKSDV